MLGISESAFNGIFTKTTTASGLSGTAASPTFIWQAGDLQVTGGSGYGILVVHNEHFDPDVFEVSDPASASYDPRQCGVVSPCNALYNDKADSSRATYDASYAPAEFRMNGNCSYTGVIIADKMLRVNGNATTVGALISLGGVNVSGDITGNWTAKYSCEAVRSVLSGASGYYREKIGWRRLR
jgi:hypothetical protein